MLKLERPLAFIDIESTGTNRETDRIIEISICKLHETGDREIKTRRVNPEMHIPATATEVHGIKYEDVANEPAFKLIAKGLLSFLDGCDVAGFNSNSFDVPMLYNEFLRAGLNWDYTKFRMIDAGNIYKIQEPRTLSAAYKFYCQKELTEAHSAEADIIATVDVFISQMERYSDLPQTVDELSLFSNYGKKLLDLSGKFTYNEAGEIVFNFGAKRGMVAKDHLDYVEWMLSKDFPPDTRAICNQLVSNTVDVYDIDNDEIPF